MRNRKQHNNNRGFQTPFLIMDRPSRQKINKETEDLKNTIEQIDLTDMYKTFHTTAAEYILLKCTWNILQESYYFR